MGGYDQGVRRGQGIWLNQTSLQSSKNITGKSMVSLGPSTTPPGRSGGRD